MPSGAARLLCRWWFQPGYARHESEVEDQDHAQLDRAPRQVALSASSGCRRHSSPGQHPEAHPGHVLESSLEKAGGTGGTKRETRQVKASRQSSVKRPAARRSRLRRAAALGPAANCSSSTRHSFMNRSPTEHRGPLQDEPGRIGQCPLPDRRAQEAATGPASATYRRESPAQSPVIDLRRGGSSLDERQDFRPHRSWHLGVPPKAGSGFDQPENRGTGRCLPGAARRLLRPTPPASSSDVNEHDV